MLRNHAFVTLTMFSLICVAIYFWRTQTVEYLRQHRRESNASFATWFIDMFVDLFRASRIAIEKSELPPTGVLIHLGVVAAIPLFAWAIAAAAK